MSKKGVILNVLLPIVLGGCLYYLYFPNIYFVKIIDNIIGNSFHLEMQMEHVQILRVVRNYIFDILWAYAFMSMCYYICCDSKNGAIMSFQIALSCSIILECLQLFPNIRGTFDGIDIICEGMAELLALFIIKKK